LRLDRVYGGSISELTEDRLAFRRRPHVPIGVFLGGTFVLYVIMSWDLPASPVFCFTVSLTAACLALPVFFFSWLPFIAVAWSVMPQVRRSLVIERDGTIDFRSSPVFRGEVDGERLAPTHRRALFEVRYIELIAHVLVLGERAITLNVCRWSELIDPTFEVEETTKAILACDDRVRDHYHGHSLMPLVQGSMRVLDLGPDRLGAFKPPRGWQPPQTPVKAMYRAFVPTFRYLDGQACSIQQLSCDAGWQSECAQPFLRLAIVFVLMFNHFATLFWLPKYLRGLEPWLLAFVCAVASFAPTVVALYVTATWLYVKPLNARAAEMIGRTPP
jgi:hypothetical protein